MADPTTSSTEPSNAEFIADLAAIRLRGASRDRWAARIGAALMPLGAALGLVGWLIARNTDNALNQRDAIILAIVGLTLSVCGSTLFLRYSFAEFLRFWLARMLLAQSPADAEASSRP